MLIKFNVIARHRNSFTLEALQNFKNLWVALFEKKRDVGDKKK